MDIVQTFELLGLTKDHLQIYLANLEWGETSISNLAYKSKIPRTTIYGQIDELIALGLVTMTLKAKKKLYTATDPEYLLSLLKQKQDEINISILKVSEKMTQLKSINNKKSASKPKVHYFEGEEGIRKVYDMTLKASEVWIQCLATQHEDVVSSEYFDDYFDKFFKKSDIRSKEILSELDEEYVSEYRSAKNLQLRVPVDTETESDIMVFDGKTVFVSFNLENPYAILIEDEGIANSMKVMYDLAWKRASTIDSDVVAGKDVKVEF